MLVFFVKPECLLYIVHIAYHSHIFTIIYLFSGLAGWLIDFINFRSYISRYCVIALCTQLVLLISQKTPLAVYAQDRLSGADSMFPLDNLQGNFSRFLLLIMYRKLVSEQCLSIFNVLPVKYTSSGPVKISKCI